MKYAMIGDGGHARDLMSCSYQYIPMRMIGPDEEPDDDEALILALVDNTARERLVLKYGKRRFVELWHHSAVIADDVKKGVACQFMAGSIVQTCVTIGDFVIFGTGAQVSHDCDIGDYAFLGPGSVCTGNVDVRPWAFIGANATILPNVTVGYGAIVGAGAVVTNDIAEEAIVAGNPAKLLRYRRDDE